MCMILYVCAGFCSLHLVYLALPPKKKLGYKQNIALNGSSDKGSRGIPVSISYFLGRQKGLVFGRRHTQQIMFYVGQLF